ncbi:MAG: amidase family protein [bacterium]
MKRLNQLTLIESRDLLVKKEISSVELTTSCLDAIEQQEGDLHAFVTILSDDALDSAKRADKEGIILPLSGIPLAIKDNFLTFGQRTTASSKVLDQFMPPYESTVTQKLKQAGAVILGKTNMDAWAHGSSTETSDYGPTHNPHDLTKLPGGSSGGSAAAVSSNETIAAIGSETAGSTKQPASWCGVVGMKPTYGRVSRYGVVAMGSSLDSPGPITKTVADSAYLLSLIAGLDPRDATSSPLSVPNYYQHLAIDLKDLRIGLPAEYFLSAALPGVNDLVKKVANQCEKLGATIIPVNLINPKYSIADYTIIQRSEVSSNLARYDGIRYGHDRTYFGDEAKRRIMLGTYALSSGYYDAYYKKAEMVRELLKQDFARVFQSVDVILAPTSPSTALSIGSSQDQAMFGELQDILLEGGSLTGLSSINVPCGLIGQLPVGAQFLAPHFHEQLILNTAYAYEQSVNWKNNKLEVNT